ncbi:MAG: GntR family transcriptional regulator, partial [Urechidicola sp.]|nr:GntR family transcriptional regulator [Urechidicola sp.]
MYFNISNIISPGIKQHKDNKLPLYQNLYIALKSEINKNTIPLDIKLPSTRILANDLKISRSTVLKAYELLVLEKFVISKQGDGYYVISKKKTFKKNETIDTPFKKSNYPKISKKALLFEKYKYITTDNFSKTSIAFRPGLPPLDLFPVKQWKTISNRYWKESTPTHLSYAPSEGLETLRLNIARYLK